MTYKTPEYYLNRMEDRTDLVQAEYGRNKHVVIGRVAKDTKGKWHIWLPMPYEDLGLADTQKEAETKLIEEIKAKGFIEIIVL